MADSTGEACLSIRHDSDVVAARRALREVGALQGLSPAAIESLATAVTEIARNMLVHASGGELRVGPFARDGRRGVFVEARDAGPGIADVALALSDGYSTGGGIGLGLSSAKRLVDEFEIDSAVGAGTAVTLRMWTAA
jgi:serine/threonine-protein kinase RsbT